MEDSQKIEHLERILLGYFGAKRLEDIWFKGQPEPELEEDEMDAEIREFYESESQ